MGYEGAFCLLDRLAFDLEGLATVTRRVRPLKAQSGKGLTDRPAESETPETEINYFQNNRAIKKETNIRLFTVSQPI